MYTRFYWFCGDNHRILYYNSLQADSPYEALKCFVLLMQNDRHLRRKYNTAPIRKEVTVLSSSLGKATALQSDDDAFCLACFDSGLSCAHTNVMLVLRQNKQNKEIADDLSISENTVETHLKVISEILKKSGRANLVKAMEDKARGYEADDPPV